MNPLTQGHIGTGRGQGLSFFTPSFVALKVLLGRGEGTLKESLYIHEWGLKTKVKIEGTLQSFLHFKLGQIEIWGAVSKFLTENLILRSILWSCHTNLIRKCKSLLYLQILIWARAFLLGRVVGQILSVSLVRS